MVRHECSHRPAVFIANDSSNRILWSAMDLPTFYAGKGADWSPSTALEGESARALFACGTIGVTTPGEVPLVNVYFLANDNTNRLLTVGFIPHIERLPRSRPQLRRADRAGADVGGATRNWSSPKR